MRIMYCLDEMSHPGGIGRVTSLKANWWAKHGHEVWIVTANQCDAEDYYGLHPSVRRKDFAIGFQLGIDNGNLLMKALRKVGKMRRYHKELEAYIYKVKPDIVVSTFTNDSDFLYKLKDGSKKVLEFHFSHEGFKSQMMYGPQSLKNKLLLTYRLKKHERLAKKYDAFVVLTHEDAEAWKGYENLHVIPNMLSFESTELSSGKEKRVIAVGRLDFQKKFDRLIGIWELVCLTNKNWHLSIYGKGPDKEMLLKMIEEKGLKDRVDIYEPTPKIKEKYQRSSIYVMTSTYEGLPMTMLEATSMGLPCIAYNFPCGPRDIIEDGRNGYLVEEGDEQIFAMRLTELMNNEELRLTMSKNAVVSSKKYNVDRVMEQWVTLFTGLLKR